MELLDGKTVVPIINKNDLENRLDFIVIKRRLGEPLIVSALDADFAERLSDEISKRLDLGRLDASAGFLANERQRACVMEAAAAVESAMAAARTGFTADVVGVALERALDAVYRLSGKVVSDEVIGEVFKRFCVGK